MGRATGERRRSRARTLEAREQELSNHAYDLAERQILDGTASSQVITHFLKMGSSRELVEQERLRGQIAVDQVRAQQLVAQERMETLVSDALDAFRSYAPQGQIGPPVDDT
jgi:hypothetical protein